MRPAKVLMNRIGRVGRVPRALILESERADARALSADVSQPGRGCSSRRYDLALSLATASDPSRRTVAPDCGYGSRSWPWCCPRDDCHSESARVMDGRHLPEPSARTSSAGSSLTSTVRVDDAAAFTWRRFLERRRSAPWLPRRVSWAPPSCQADEYLPAWCA